MKLQSIGEQQTRHFSFDASGSIASGVAPQLVLPESRSRCSLFFQNVSAAPMWYQFGGARATATITNGVVTSVTVTNAGFGYTMPPIIRFYGGAYLNGTPPSLGAGLYGFPSPTNGATAAATLSAGAVSAITVINGGSGYETAPYVHVTNREIDPFGAFDPSASGGSGFQLAAGQSIYQAYSSCTTDALSVFCATSGSNFTCLWMP